MKRIRIKNPSRFIPWVCGLVIVITTAISLVAAVVFGSVDTTWSITIQVISHHLFRTELDESVPISSDTIIQNLRVPREVPAVTVGAGLTVSGVAVQTLVRNPLADPYLLGISVDTGAGATAVIIFDASSGSPTASLTFGVLLGVVMATLVAGVLVTAGGGLAPLRLMFSGVMLSIALSALSSLTVFAGSDPRVVQPAMLWMPGPAVGATWVKTLFPLIALIAVLLFFLVKARQLDALATGEGTATVVGTDVTRLRTQVFVLQVVLVGTLVAVSGGVGFVGLVVPHLTRILVGVIHRAVSPVAALMGGLLLIWVDIIVRVVGGSQEMLLGAVTGLVGAPLFLYLMSCPHYSYGGTE